MILKVKGLLLVSALIVLIVFPATRAVSQEYEAMQGVSDVNTVFDFRVSDPQVTLGGLDLIHTMMSDPSLMIDGRPPEIVVVFIGPAVRLVSTDDELGVAAGPRDAIAEKISTMDADGVKFEVCMATAQALGVSPDSLLPELVQVGNGWISVIGYQHNGYSMVANF